MAGGKLKSGILEYCGANTPGWVSNLGLSLSGGVLTVVDAQGAALSPSNPGWVTVPSTTGGQMVTLKVTVGGVMNDDVNASSDLTNLGFGIDETANWAVDVPFWVYVVNRANSNIDGADGSSVFMVARNPCMYTTGSVANDIGDTGAIPTNDSEIVMLIMDDVTVANYTSLPATLVATFRMRWSTVTDDWTVQSLGTSDGFGWPALNKQFSRTWSFPTGQNGAGSSTTHIRANAGTAPEFVTNDYSYKIRSNGLVDIGARLTGDNGTDGAGAVATHVTLPYMVRTRVASSVEESVIGTALGATTITGGAIAIGSFVDANQYVGLQYPSSATNISNITNAMFSNGGRTIQLNFSYNAFNAS